MGAGGDAGLPLAQAERQLAAVERDLAALEKRWETTTTAELAKQLEAHSVTLLSAKPGEEAGTFILEVEGSAHGLGQALPEIEKAATAGRLPAVLFLRRVKRRERRRARFRLEGGGRTSDWTRAPPPAEGKP